jgi:hypothetical protein
MRLPNSSDLAKVQALETQLQLTLLPTHAAI